MRTVLLLFITFSVFTVSYGQDTLARRKICRNEVGVDVTAFLRQFLPVGSASAYIPLYYVTYRRHFKPGNFRFGAGLTFKTTDGPDIYHTNDDHLNQFEMDARIGWEWVNDFHSRWQVFYGLDFRPSVRVNQQMVTLSNDSEVTRSEVSQYYGFSPFLGFRFRCTSRLSLTTESSYSIIYSQYSTKVTGDDLSGIESSDKSGKRLYGYFTQPLSVIATFDF